MSIKSAADREGLEAAGRVVSATLEALAAAVRPGVTTADLDAVAARIFEAHGARSAPALVYGFPGTVLISVNDEVVHGVPGRRRIQTGDVVKLDVIRWRRREADFITNFHDRAGSHAPALTTGGDSKPYGAQYSPALPLNPHVKYFDGDRRGYLKGTLSPSRLSVDLRYVTKVEVHGGGGYLDRTFVVEDGRPGAALIS